MADALRRGPRPSSVRKADVKRLVAGAIEGGATLGRMEIVDGRVVVFFGVGPTIDAAADAEKRMRDAFGE